MTPSRQDAESLRLARQIVRGLISRAAYVVLAPGSRSAPLAYALAEAERAGEIAVHVRIDERSAAFTALGIALSLGEPVGVVTTSGTATGNLLPAIMEADMSGVPLVAITADRPAELHGTGANQTTWQQGMFAGRIRRQVHIEQGTAQLEPLPDEPRSPVEAEVGTLLNYSLGDGGLPAGPVHLNIGFRDPLVPAEGTEEEQPSRAQSRSVQNSLAHTSPVDTSSAQRSATPGPAASNTAAPDTAHRVLAQPGRTEGVEAQPPREAGEDEIRTLFVMGHQAPAEAAQLAARKGQPILAEPSSGARAGEFSPIQGYRLILQAPPSSSAGQLVEQAERVVVAGRPTLSRPVQRLIARDDVDVVQYAPGAEPWFPQSQQNFPRRVVTGLAELAVLAGRAPEDWSREWQHKSESAQQLIDAAVEAEARRHAAPNSVQVAKYTAEQAQPPLLLGSSSVIRDVDLAAVLPRGDRDRRSPDKESPEKETPAKESRKSGAPTQDEQTRDCASQVYALRGLSGIDGNLSAASGIALGTDRRVTAIVGDLTFLHDLNALLLPVTEQTPELDVVVVNDGGGAIFDQLEHGEVGRRPGQAESVERLFGTPQAADLEKLVTGYGHQYWHARSLDELGALLKTAGTAQGIRVIEVRTDRRRLRDFHADLRSQAAEL